MKTEKRFAVTTVNGKTYTWRFVELKGEGDYGNGIYIAIEHPSGDTSSLDCRYDKAYNFTKVCVEYLYEYYGDNLDELYEEDDE